MMENSVSRRLIKGIKLRKDSQDIHHLQFTDDIIILMQHYEHRLKNYKILLQCFQLTSCLKINISKSYIYARGIKDSSLQRWVDILSCSVTYLGAPIEANTNSKFFFGDL